MGRERMCRVEFGKQVSMGHTATLEAYLKNVRTKLGES
jgi:hypothetical protein